MIEENKKILEDIKNAKLTKLTQSYSKMRAGNAAKILQNMKPKDALEILQRLKPKIMAKILSKMDPAKAAILTKMMQGEK